jgi:hypothetical protein
MGTQEDSRPKHRERGQKPRYETPEVMPLGELARSFGNVCSAGTNVGGGGNQCRVGTAAISCQGGQGGRGGTLP